MMSGLGGTRSCAPDQLGAPSYWDIRYEKEQRSRLRFENFDWYCPIEQLWGVITQVVEVTERHKVLLLGCGSSSTIDLLYKHGFRDITAIDISPTIVQDMQKKYKDFPGVDFYCMDMQKLNRFPDKTFTFVFDKGGIDALFCTLDFTFAVRAAVAEIYRVLRDEAVFVCVSHGGPRSRVPYFRSVDWAVDTLPLQDNVGETLSFYVMRRTTNRAAQETMVKGAEYVRQRVSDKIVTTFNQKMNKVSSYKMDQYKGQVTVSTHSDDVMRLVKECEETDKALAAEMVRTMPKAEKEEHPASFLFKKLGTAPASDA